jgi:multidrug efflux pump subunit AcrA (membrane-fusion protein)
MEIVPSDDKLVMEAKVQLSDIDVVRVGQEVNVRMQPFKSKIVPPLEGKIVSLSSDVAPPEYQGDHPHYKARIEFNSKSLNDVKNLKGAELLPGMRGSVMIKVGTRTFLQYLLDPLTSSFSKAFIEQ